MACVDHGTQYQEDSTQPQAITTYWKQTLKSTPNTCYEVLSWEEYLFPCIVRYFIHPRASPLFIYNNFVFVCICNSLLGTPGKHNHANSYFCVAVYVHVSKAIVGHLCSRPTLLLHILNMTIICTIFIWKSAHRKNDRRAKKRKFVSTNILSLLICFPVDSQFLQFFSDWKMASAC